MPEGPPELVAFELEAGVDDRRHREGVRALFRAQVAYQRWREARGDLEGALLLGSVLPGISLVLPASLPAIVRIPAFATWAGLFGLNVVARIAERRARVGMLRCADTLRAGRGR